MFKQFTIPLVLLAIIGAPLVSAAQPNTGPSLGQASEQNAATPKQPASRSLSALEKVTRAYKLTQVGKPTEKNLSSVTKLLDEALRSEALTPAKISYAQ